MAEIDDAVNEVIEDKERESRLNTAVGVLVAIVATLMAIGNIKDGNICQAMAKDQAGWIDSWSHYQAKSTKQHIEQKQLELFKLQLITIPGLTAAGQQAIRVAAKGCETEIARYNTEKAANQKEAEAFQSDYDRLNFHDDQFDMSEAFFTIAIALFGITILIQKKWLFGIATAASIIGLVLSIAGFAGWIFHPDWLARLLG